MSNTNKDDFFNLYQNHRYEDQLTFYSDRVEEYHNAHDQAILISIILVTVTAIAAAFGAIPSFSGGIKLALQFVAVILPILSTAIIGYDGLYDFEQQAKFYRDSIDNLILARKHLEPAVLDSLDAGEYAKRVEQYVKDVERVFSDEQGQWGQLAKKPNPQQ